MLRSMVGVLKAFYVSLQVLSLVLFYLTFIASNHYFLEETILVLYQGLSFFSYMTLISGALFLTLRLHLGHAKVPTIALALVFWIPPLLLYLLARSVLVFIQTTGVKA